MPSPSTPLLLLSASLLVLLLAGGLLGLAVWLRHRGRQRSDLHLDRAVALRRHELDELDEADFAVLGALPARLAFLRPVVGLLDQSLGRALVAREDRELLDQAGHRARHHRALYLLLRLGALVLGLGLVLFVLPQPASGSRQLLLWMSGGVGGLMLPKLLLRRQAGARLQQAREEVPLLVDLLRLLQGTGMSLDQTLQIIAAEFRAVLPVLGLELESANRQFSAGRARAETLKRLARSYQDEDLANLVALLGQIDRHGGAVQEPLRQFSDRLREKRRAALRETVGKLNVKMTGVMVVTLLPALMIVVAGPGFLAIVRSIGALR